MGRNELSLSLLMLRVLANNTTHHLSLAIATNDEATIFAYLLDGSADFHEAEEKELSWIEGISSPVSALMRSE